MCIENLTRHVILRIQSAPPSDVELGSRKRKAVRMPNLQRWAMDTENSKSTASARGASVPAFRTSNTGPDGRMRKGSGGSKSPSVSSAAGVAPGGGCPVAGDDAPSAAAVGASHPSAAASGQASAAASLCAGCGLPIVDRYILRVMDHSWHEACLQCSVCHAPLEQSCYSRDRKLFCKADYDKLFGVKCAGCLGCIAPSELVMRALEHVFHVACFACVVCGRTLQKGDQFVVRAARLYCRPDFEKEMALVSMAHHGQSQPSQQHAQPQHPAHGPNPNAALPGARGENGPLPGGGPNGQPNTAGPGATVRPDGRRGPKRPRTILTTAQRRAFKASFEISQKPCRKVRETLAKETGLSVRIVQVWFQNQRAKLKKIQRKQQQQQQQQQQQSQQNAGGDSSGSEMASSTKDSKKSDDGRQSASPADLSSPPFSRLGLLESAAVSSPYQLQPLPYGTHHDGSYYGPTHGDPTYLKSEISMESETSLSGLEDVLIGAGGGGGQPPPALADAMFASSAVNPIDKLYSMQTSYFSNNECECLGGSN